MLTVFNIQKYSIHDGTGVRTNIFFKGCTLHCSWCNNPEGIDSSPSVMFDERTCHMLGNCLSKGDGVIPGDNNRPLIRRELISDAAAYRNICPAKALFVSGEEKSIAAIIKEIEKDIPFYEMSGGGVTLTGGEPLAQGSDLVKLISILKEKDINVSVETSLHLPWEIIENYVNLVDTFLADLKHLDKEKFLKYTGGNSELVLENFKKLDGTGANYIVRVPVIPGFNYSKSELTGIIDFAAGLKNVSEINFIPYHSLAKEKYLMLGKEYTFGNQKNIEKTELLKFAQYAEEKGLISKILN
jgi:pyruvate formate lyase activating enzyme